MKNLVLACLCLTIGALHTSAQDYLISDGGEVELDCSIATTLADAGGAGNYGPGESFSMTFCPGAGGNAATFLIDTETAGDLFDIPSGDALTIFDGPDTSSPILGVYNNGLHDFNALPVVFLNATLDNLSGCLTILFESSASSPGAPGFTASLGCGNFWQPYSMNFTSSPSEVDDFGYIDICQGETITIVADGDFPYSDGSGYEQTNENCFFEWDLGDGTELEGYGLTTVTNTYTEQFGYPIELYVTDPEGFRQRFELKVRVSTTPSFAGLLSQSNDTICLGSSATLIGGVAQDSSTSFGVLPIQSAFIGGGFLAGQTFLPDGSGVSYETTITIDDFPVGSTVENPDDIVAVCATLEHSYLGDLDIELTCPNGTTILLQGQAGGSCNLGVPWATGGVDGQSSVITPGEGYEYCWTADAVGGLDEGCVGGIEFVSGDGPGTYTDSQVPEGNYEPDQPLTDLIGCPINGEWTITVTDNIGADNGYIFSWGVQFNPSIDPTVENYQPIMVDGYWEDEPTINPDLSNDTLIVVEPPALGQYSYTFHVTDDFECSYDTTVVLTVIEPSSVAATSPACDLTTELQVFSSLQGGVWTYSPSDSIIFLPADINGDAVALSAGDYTFTYSDFFCQTEETVEVFFPPYPDATIDPDSIEICIGEGNPISVVDQPFDIPVSYLWSVDSAGTLYTLGFGQVQEAAIGGDYSVVVTSDICPSMLSIGSAYVLEEPCIIETFNVFTPNGDGENDFFYIEAIDKFDDPLVFVYNRWGNVVFERKNYTNNWDMDGLPEGTYYYVIQNPANNEAFKGYFTLVR
ncbi:MAG: T9SS type B sorting domain-containing protein [Flavobacteriales bacterium]|nr:T9SS type B sorting domain-containing protein [Flavobacteriales bacterium]